MQKLDSSKLAAWLAEHPSWHVEDKTLVTSFTFRDFSEAWGFMNRIALLAEQLNHHPDWSNSYSRVDISLCTHDAGALTEKDLEFATAVDAITDM